MKNIDEKQESLSSELYEKLDASYSADEKNYFIRHALIKNKISEVIYNNENQAGDRFVFSKEIKTLPVCNQKMSGRCWIFAALNVLREIIAKKLNLADFELSQNYVALFDKLEKANYELTSIISLIDDEPDSRVLMHVLQWGVSDGGQWDMFKNIVKKYGIVPKSVFDETAQSSATMESNQILNCYLRKFAFEAQNLAKEGKKSEIPALKEEYLKNIYALLVNCFGEPIKEFDFEYVDKDNNYHIEQGLTPKSFFDKYIGETIDEYVSIIHSPTKDKPFGKVFTIDYLNNVVEGDPIKHLNLPMERIKELVEAQISEDNIVWFGSDCGFFRGDRAAGVWDDKALDYKKTFNIDLRFDKAAMLDYHASMMNHAMCLTGFNKVGNKVNRYKVENSWGSEAGNKGYFLMTDTWFDSFVYQAVILKKYLTKEELAAYEADPIHLNPWDPMGTLAD